MKREHKKETYKLRIAIVFLNWKQTTTKWVDLSNQIRSDRSQSNGFLIEGFGRVVFDVVGAARTCP